MDWKEFAEDIWEDIRDRGYYILAVALILLVPFLLGAPGFSQIPILSDIYNMARSAGLFDANTYVLKILSLCLIWAIFAAAWDLLSGYTGQVSFGHAVFWGIAAYATFWFATGFSTVIVLIDIDPANPVAAIIGTVLNILITLINPILQFFLGPRIKLDPLTALIFGGVTAAFLALIIGIIALRVKGPYLALVTLIIPLIIGGLIPIYKELFGPSFGIPNVPSIIESVGDRETDALNFYILSAAVFLVSIGTMMLIAFSRIGLAFQSVREDEDAAESLGINLRNYKILAFTVSAFFAGIAGGMYSQWLDFTGPSFFGSSFSFSVIIMVVIGGVGSISGGVIGAFLLTILVKLFLNDIFRGVHGLDIIAYGLLLVFTLRYMRFGLARATKEQKRACVLGIVFALSWAVFVNSDILGLLETLTIDSILTFVTVLLLFIFALPAIPVFVVSEIVGLFVLQGFLGISMSSATLLKAKFLIYVIVGIPYAYYLPKLFKQVRLRFWGVWPSAGRYEPD